MSEKLFIKADSLVQDAFLLADQIHASGFRPDVILVIWRGGTPIGIVVHEYFRFRGVDTYHAVVKAESYTGIEQRIEPRIIHLDPILQDIHAGSHILLIDDIFDSGGTIKKMREALSVKCQSVKVATLYYKEANNETDIEPDYFLKKTDKWVVFPHELSGLNLDEIRQKGDYLADLLS